MSLLEKIILKYFPKEKTFDSQADTINENIRNCKIYNLARRQCMEAVKKAIREYIEIIKGDIKKC